MLRRYRKDPLGFYQGRIELLKIMYSEKRGSKYLKDIARCKRILQEIWNEIYYQNECRAVLAEHFLKKEVKK